MVNPLAYNIPMPKLTLYDCHETIIVTNFDILQPLVRYCQWSFAKFACIDFCIIKQRPGVIPNPFAYDYFYFYYFNITLIPRITFL